MGFQNNQFPVFLTLKTDGTLQAETRRFEDFITGSMGRVTRAVNQAGFASEGAFNFGSSKRELGQLETAVDGIIRKLSQARADPLGIGRSLSGLKNSPHTAGLSEQIAAENKLNDQRQRTLQEVAAAEASLDAQRQRAAQERLVQIQREFDATMAAINAKRAAQAAAFEAVQREGDRILALDRQRAEEQRRAVTGREFIQAPGFNPQFAQQSATAARAHAAALDQVARAAENVSLQSAKATATDVAFANQMRVAATAAGIEAARLEELAATQLRVAGAAGKLNTANLDLTHSVRGSRFATLQASQQFQDFFIQVQGGQNPMVAFSQQASQLAFVMSQAGGEAGKVARFLSGGWGTAVFIGLAALTPFVSKLWETEKASKKVKEAKDIHRKTVLQLVEAIEAESEALGKGNQLSFEAEKAALLTAEAKLKEAEGRKLNALNIIAEMRAEMELNRQRSQVAGLDPRITGPLQAENEALEARVNQLEDTLKVLEVGITKARVSISSAQVPISRRANEEANDPAAKIRGDYERAVAAATAAYHAEADKLANTGTDVDKRKAAEAKYRSALDRATDAQSAAEKALEERRKAESEAAREAKKTATYSQFRLPFAASTISSGFGRRDRPTAGASTNHPALDFAVPSGTPVTNPGTKGIVIHSGRLGGFGNAIIIDYGGGTMAQFSHLSKLAVSKGQEVSPDQVIGNVGSTGVSTGAHLDYRLKVGGKYVDPRKTARVPTDETNIALAVNKANEAAAKAAEKALADATKEADRLATLGANAQDRIAGLTAQWDRQPRLIDAAAKATDDLNETIARLNKEKPPGFEQLVADAEKAKGVVQEGLVRPLQDYVEQSAKAAQIDTLVLEGKEDQAEVMREIVRLEEQMGPLTEKQRQAVEQTVTAERLRAKQLEANERSIQRAVQSANVLQDAVTGVIADPSFSSFKEGLKSVFADFQDAWASNISRGLLGNLGEDFEGLLRAKSDPLGQAGAELTDSALELHKSAVALSQAASTMGSQGGPTAGQVSQTPSAYLPTGAGAAGLSQVISPIARMIGGPTGSILDIFGQISGIFGQQNSTSGQILNVNTDVADLAARQLQLQQRSALLSDPVQYYNMLGSTVGKKLDQTLGTNFVGKLGGKLGDVMQGIQLGQMGGQLAGMLGLKTSNTGAMLGGIAGSLIGGPLGALIGGAIGGIIGGLFKKTKKGSATIGADQYGNLDVTDTDGNSNKRKRASTEAGDTAIGALEQLADQLGVLVDASKASVSIGIREGDYRVDTTGQGKTKKSATVKNFGEDAKSAIEFAIQDMIKDGVLEGIRAGTKKLLVETRDLARGIEKALKFEGVFTRLKEIEDPVGAAVDKLDKEFTELRRIFVEAGASAEEYTQLEKLYAYERAEAVKNAAQQLTATLKALLDDLTHRGDFGLSLRTRRENAMATFAPYQQAIASGQTVDQDAFADAARTLLQIERELYGSTSQYFETLNMITTLTRAAISNTGQPVSVPGLTPTIVPTAPGAPMPTTSPTAGVSTQAPGGALTAGQALANQQYTMAQMIVVGIREQTAVLSGLLSLGSLAVAIQTGIIMGFNVIQSQSGAGGQNYDQLTSGFGQMNSTLGQIAQNTLQLTQAGDTLFGAGNSMFGTPWWMAPGAGSAYNPPAPTYRNSSFGSSNDDYPDDPLSRLSVSVSGFG